MKNDAVTDYAELFGLFGFAVHDEALLQEAFVHRSAMKLRQRGQSHNERLEFLGDAVLELITTEYLFHHFPDKPEGDLTNYRSSLVRGDHLAVVAKRLNLGQYMLMSAGERRSGGAEKEYILANAVEALIGAVYVSEGMELTRRLVERFVLVDLENIIAQGDHIDAKSHFQEIVQGQLGVTPHYALLSATGKDHEKTFTMGAMIGEKQVSQGTGASKKEAQAAAAKAAIAVKDDWLGR